MQNGTKKLHVQAVIEFLEFVLNQDDVDVDERRALRTIGSLRRSLIDFAKGAKKYAAERRMNISEAIRNDEFPTYTEVSMVVEELAEELLCCYF